MPRFFLAAFAVILSISFSSSFGDNAVKEEKTDIYKHPIRVIMQDWQIAKMDVATIRYRKGETLVDMTGVVHVADAKYYRMLNKRFEHYDSVLYELVAPEGSLIPDRQRSGGLQDIMKGVLRLEHQMAVIDYNAINFYHADMTIEALKESMAKKGDTVMTIAAEVLLNMVRDQNKAAYAKANGLKAKAVPQIEVNLMAIMMGDARESNRLKQMMAAQFASDTMTSQFGSTIGNYLIDERNKAAMKVVDERLRLGDKKICVFYGAAHLEDFHKRMTDRGFKVELIHWDTAWDNMMPKNIELDPTSELIRLLLEE